MLASAPRLVRVTSPSRMLDRSLLHASGGFAWWYLDALDENGDGVVVIWSFGLPFLPGYRASARRGEAPPARERPSVNVAVYRGGREVFYLLQEVPTEEASWSGDGTEWHIGQSTMRSVERDGRREVSLRLDCRIPGSDARLTGEIDLDGVARRPVPSAPCTLDDHDWSPLTGPARVRARLRVDDAPLLDFDGRGYHDRNGSRTPFDRLGIAHWIWGRVPASDRELVYYLLWPEDGGEPEAVALEIDGEGRTTEVPVSVHLHGGRRAKFGMPYWDRVELRCGERSWLDVRHGALLDDGPFYLRLATAARRAGEPTLHGTAELVRPSRVDLALLRPFVKMRVDHTGERGSRWRPLFTGPTEGRVARQARALLPAIPRRPVARLLGG